MNWFERYAIPGAFFVLLAVLLGAALYGDEFADNWPEIRLGFQGVVLGLAAAAIPIGYVLSILGQVVYYSCIWRGLRLQLHVPVLKDAGCSTTNKEWVAEAAITFVGRWHHHYLGKDGLGRSRFLTQWFQKRTDVMAMNTAMILGTGLLMLPALFYMVVGPPIDPMYSERVRYVIWWSVGASFILVVLLADNWILAKQAQRMVREYVRDLNAPQNPITTTAHQDINECLERIQR